ncbi:glycosyltransferase [Bacteroides propionicifaciens]|uniref:glycosyltransferase n=1 Tax=Bacteroides propionicifaciens TaxID=392838 RepID=UPI00035DA5FA|nr:glycosyltransferase [Bacteroides propionicifaciens]
MSCLFIHDHKFYCTDSNVVYTTGTLNANLWQRYTSVFGSLTVFARQSSKRTAGVLASSEDVKFELLDSFLEILKIKKTDYFIKLDEHIKKTDFIIVRLPSMLGIYATFLCKKYNKKYMVEVVGCAYDSFKTHGSFKTKIFASIWSYFNKRAIYNSDWAVYVTENYLQNKYPSKGISISASNVVLDKIASVNPYLKKPNISNKTFIIGCIGNVELAYKGYAILLKSLSILEIDFKLHLIGGENFSYIQDLITKYNLNEKVVLHGKILDRDLLFKLIDNFDLFIQPSLTEGLPRSVIEAMSRGCPVLASDAGGTYELINSSYVYPKYNNKILAGKIRELRDNNNLLKKASNENFLASKKFKAEILNKKRTLFYNQIINNK